MPGFWARALQCVQFLRMPVGTGVPDCPFFLALSLPQSPFVRMFFGFALRNRRRSADEEKLRETQCVSYSSPPSGGAKFDCARDGGQQTAPYDMCEFCVYLRGQSRTPVPTDWWGTIRVCASFAHTCADSRGRLSLQIGEGRFAFARGCGRTKRKKEESRSSLLFFCCVANYLTILKTVRSSVPLLES